MAKKIPLEALSEGDVLASDVTERSGRLILGRGRAVTRRHIETLRAWGILEVDVCANAEDEAEPADEALAKARESVLPRFALNDANQPLITALIELCAEQALARMQRAGSGGSVR